MKLGDHDSLTSPCGRRGRESPLRRRRRSAARCGASITGAKTVRALIIGPGRSPRRQAAGNGSRCGGCMTRTSRTLWTRRSGVKNESVKWEAGTWGAKRPFHMPSATGGPCRASQHSSTPPRARGAIAPPIVRTSMIRWRRSGIRRRSAVPSSPRSTAAWTRMGGNRPHLVTSARSNDEDYCRPGLMRLVKYCDDSVWLGLAGGL
jgi:hypothetical protein